MEELEATSSEQDPAEPPNCKVRKQFLNKLFTLLEENKYSDIMCWTDDGEKFVIKNPVAAAKFILPKLFNHNNYSSFTRQLSFYRFKRFSDRPDSRIYCHPSFKSGRPDLLDHIERAKHASAPKDKKEKGKSSSKPNFEYERVQLLSRICSLTEQLESTKEYVLQLEDENTKLRLKLKDELERDYRARELLASLENTSRVQRPRFLDRFRVKPNQQTFIDPSASNNNHLFTLPVSHSTHINALPKPNLKGYEVKTQNVSQLVVNPQKPRYLLKTQPSPVESFPKRQSIDYQGPLMLNDFDSSFIHTDDDDFFAANRTSDTPNNDDLMGFGFQNLDELGYSINK